MGNIVQFTGITKLPLDPDLLLEEAIGKLDEVVIIGFDKDGNEYVALSNPDAGDAIYHCERLKHKLMLTIDDMS